MQSSFTIASDHPCLNGHFPDHPVVPGVVTLDHVIEAVEYASRRRVTAIRRCKFVRPLYPDTPCHIEWQLEGDAVRFACRSAEGVLVQGISILAPIPTGHDSKQARR